MSIDGKKKRQNPAASSPENETPSHPPRRKRRRLLTIVGVAILAVVLLVALLPTILVHTPLMGRLVRRAAMLDGAVSFRSASIGWFSPASVSGVEIRDAQGETVIEVDNLASDRSLLKLLFSSANAGKLRIEKPRLNVKLTRDGSNLETVLARWLTGPSGTASQGVDLSLEIADGEAVIVDAETQQSWHVTALQFALDMTRRLAWPTRMEGTATVDDHGRAGGLTWKSHLKIGDAPPANPAAAEGDLSLQITALPLAMFQRLASRAAPGLKLDGTLASNFEAQWSGPGNLKLSGTMDVHNFQLAAPQQPAWSEDDLAIILSANGQTDFGAQTRIDTATLQLRSGGDMANIRLLQPVAEIGARAAWPLDVQVQGRVDRWPALLASLLSTQCPRMDGSYQASGQVTLSANSLAFSQTKINTTQLALAAPAWNWSEPAIELNAAGRYDFASARLQFDSASLATSAIALNLNAGAPGTPAAAQVVLGNPADVQMSGDMTYQWDRLNPLLEPYTGTSVRFFGTGTSPIAYHGPCWPAQGEGSAALRFAGANLYGFQVGPGELRLRLANGILRADPLEATCNRGRLALQPELRMDRQPMEFRVSAGTLASLVQLDEAACHSALKYVVPILDSVTNSKGQFSIQLDGCRIPLGDLNRAEIAGRIIVHSAEINPGPLVRQMASLVAASPSLVHIEPESVILFRMTGGRIYHQGLALQFPELTMRTYGSVGLDDSLKLMVETSVPLAWLPSNAVTEAIKKRKMQIPVGGTLKSPQLDRDELARIKSQLLSNLGVLESQLGNQLNRLIQPQR